MDKTKERGLFIAGGVGAIAWPILSEFVFYAVYPLLAGSGVTPQPGGPEGMMMRLAVAGQRPALVALEFSIGLASVLTGLPISLAVAHNWFAGLLLLALLKMLALSRTPEG